MPSPTARTLALMRRSGYLAAVVETWIPHVNRRRDLFGVFDVLAVRPVRREIALIQTTTADHLAHRLAKMKAAAELPGLLAAGCKVQAHGWKWTGTRWAVKIIDVQAETLKAVVTMKPSRKAHGRDRLPCSPNPACLNSHEHYHVHQASFIALERDGL